MTRIVFLALLITLVSLFPVETVFAQTSGASLEAEIQNLERAITRQGIPAAERHDSLVRLARLRQLSGDIEGAARNWLEAATAIPGRVDDDALLNCAYCLAAMGEWDRAATALEPLLHKSARARFLDLSIRAIRTGDMSALAAIVDNPEYSGMKSEIIFLLWRISTGPHGTSAQAERWRLRLINEFPQTPEGRLAASTGSFTTNAGSIAATSTIIVRPTPFWLFAGGLDSLPLVASGSVPPPSQTTTAAAAQPATSTARLQTGIFGVEVNAQAQAASLSLAGFTPSIERRTVNNAERWAVTVPAGTDQIRTMNALRAAGFDSFLVR